MVKFVRFIFFFSVRLEIATQIKFDLSVFLYILLNSLFNKYKDFCYEKVTKIVSVLFCYLLLRELLCSKRFLSKCYSPYVLSFTFLIIIKRET